MKLHGKLLTANGIKIMPQQLHQGEVYERNHEEMMQADEEAACSSVNAATSALATTPSTETSTTNKLLQFCTRVNNHFGQDMSPSQS